MNRIIFFILIMIFSFSTTNAQQLNDFEKNQLKLAQAYEMNANYNAAAEILAELYDSKPNNQDIFDSYIRVFVFLHKYSEIIDNAVAYSERNPSPKNYATIASIYWKLGETKSAENSWDKAISKFPEFPETYILISNEQVLLRQYENAINTLLLGRKNLKNSVIFADYLSRYYSFTGNYESGFKEVLLLANDPGQGSLAKGRLYTYIENENAKNYIRKEFSQKINEEPQNYIMLDLYAWFLRTIKDYDSAFDTYRLIDDFRKSQGRELYNYAYSSLQDGQFKPAEKAFNYIINNIKNSPYRVNAFMGLAQTLDEQVKQSKFHSSELYTNIIKQYDNIAQQFPNTSQADEALYRAAVIVYENLNEHDNAIKRFEVLSDKKRNSFFKTKALLMLGKINIVADKSDNAKQYFYEALKTNNISIEDKDIALFNLAELEYFYGNLDSAKTKYSQITKNAESFKANDALHRIGMIESNQNQIDAFTKYRKAELLLLLNNSNQAAMLFIDAANSSFEDFFTEEALLKAADIYFNTNDFITAKNTYSLIIEKFPKGIFTDYVYFRLGDIAATSNLDNEAIVNYTKILTDFPKSIYLQEARDKARILRDKVKS